MLFLTSAAKGASTGGGEFGQDAPGKLLWACFGESDRGKNLSHFKLGRKEKELGKRNSTLSYSREEMICRKEQIASSGSKGHELQANKRRKKVLDLKHSEREELGTRQPCDHEKRTPCRTR